MLAMRKLECGVDRIGALWGLWNASKDTGKQISPLVSRISGKVVEKGVLNGRNAACATRLEILEGQLLESYATLAPPHLRDALVPYNLLLHNASQ
jgi:hypothetical protein